MSENEIFVVHGRNERITDAMYTFLRAIDLKPLEWEQALAATGKATATTLEIVKTGIETAKCIIVLFTGDDLAKLNPEYGIETEKPQPRPNVIFEAGWALAEAGQQNTILICVGDLRGFSDIDGLNYVKLDNSSDARKAVVSRLKSAGCQVNDTGSDYLSPSRGGDFSLKSLLSENTQSKSYAELLDRGKFTEYVADSSLSFTLSNIELNREFYSDLRQVARVDLKYHYLGAECASYWINLSQHPDYGHAELREVIEDTAREMLNKIFDDRTNAVEDGKIDLISLGPGDGEIDARLLHRMQQEKLQVEYYYSVDISFDLLQFAVANVIRSDFLEHNFRIKAIHGDFTQLERLKAIYTFDQSINLFSLLGFTLGNYNEAHLLRQIRRGMNVGDYLLVDARLHGLDEPKDLGQLSKDEQQIITHGYSHKLNNHFAFGPVEMATGSRADSMTFGYDVNNRITVVPGGINVVTYCTELDTWMRTTGEQIRKERLDLAATTLYSYDSLREWLLTRGFHEVWSNKKNKVVLFLLRKID
jgi:hypothetical protein